MPSLSRVAPRATPRLFSIHASPWRFPACRALSNATRWLALQSAQLPRLLKMLNSGAGSRQAMSCRPDARPGGSRRQR